MQQTIPPMSLVWWTQHPHCPCWTLWLSIIFFCEMEYCIWLVWKMRQRWQRQSCLCHWSIPSGGLILCFCLSAPCGGWCSCWCCLPDDKCFGHSMPPLALPVSFDWPDLQNSMPTCALPDIPGSCAAGTGVSTVFCLASWGQFLIARPIVVTVILVASHMFVAVAFQCSIWKATIIITAIVVNVVLSRSLGKCSASTSC